MSNAAVKVDPDYYNRRLLETDADQSRRVFSSPSVIGSMGGVGLTGSGAGRGMGGYQDSTPDLPDYLVRQHSLLGLYLSLFPRDEGKCCSVRASPLLSPWDMFVHGV